MICNSVMREFAALKVNQRIGVEQVFHGHSASRICRW
jgi:hypothetical protein